MFTLNNSILNESVEILSVVPNPAKDFFRINYYLTDQLAEYKFRILDFKGNLIEELACNRNSSFLDMTITNYPSGLYFVSLVKNGAIRKAQRLIIIK
ncbi:MAG: T9SS type A sorting domain-containing protein [Saprospiraceae bacterium]|uniref:T9SS type A sorting domain-containing protein n=1 Tax=Candidatus Defluviibacterium haderslevense TaxID=2981993 RepID=A0A9D7S7J7_9BACT|nr:T9SS type A sorting domain-containing protein [Candidatus Defluviibacterium haderslevense]